tara:strand:- start:9133 stop:9606 length:474 start_codon:yes stop_codon:yes gene_type:complete
MPRKREKEEEHHHVTHNFGHTSNIIIGLFIALIVVGGIKMINTGDYSFSLETPTVGRATAAASQSGISNIRFLIGAKSVGEICLNPPCDKTDAFITIRDGEQVLAQSNSNQGIALFTDLPQKTLTATFEAPSFYSKTVIFEPKTDGSLNIGVQLTRN